MELEAEGTRYSTVPGDLQRYPNSVINFRADGQTSSSNGPPGSQLLTLLALPYLALLLDRQAGGRAGAYSISPPRYIPVHVDLHEQYL